MIEVRPAVPDDAAAVKTVEASAIATLRKTYRPNQAALANRARLAPRLKRIVATIGGRVVGTVQYFVENQAVRVIGLSVHADFRRRGVARAMFRFLEEIGKGEGATCFRLFTVKQTGNVEVFSRIGFRIVAERKDDFSESDMYDTLTEVEMEKQFQ